MCSVCSAALEAFGAARTLSAPIQHAKSEEVGYRPSGPWDNDWCVSCMTILTGDMLATQCVGGGGILEYCAGFVFLRTPFRHFLFSCRATCLLHLAQAQNVHAAVELAARQNGAFNATFLPKDQTKGNRVVG